jgi:putative cardiolipin synthase
MLINTNNRGLSVSNLTKIIIFSPLFTLLFISGCATLPQNFERPESHALTDTGDTHWGRLRQDERAAHPGQSGFILLANGLDAFVARALMAEFAERSIDVQYYLYHDDLTGRLLTHQLLKAANRGVRVRLLVDDMGLGGRDLSVSVLDSHPNIEVRIFNPFSRNVGRLSQFVTRLGSVTRRMHNKSFTVDNQATILGGRNIGNEYFDADPDIAFADLDVLLIGPVVADVSASFDTYWNSELVYPINVLTKKPPTPEEIQEKTQKFNEFIVQQENSPYLLALRNSDLANEIRQQNVRYYWGDAEAIFDRPEKILDDRSRSDDHLVAQFKPYWDKIENELIILSPYFVPGKEGVESLVKLKESGVDIRILTNSLASTDVGVVHAGYAKYRKDLLRAGIELYELNKKISKKERKGKKGQEGSSKASLHAKTFNLDRKWVFIGSFNLDPRSVYENTEIGVVMDSPEIAQYMAQKFDANIATFAFRLELRSEEDGGERILWHGYENGKKRVYTADPYTGFWRRLGVWFMGLLPIESQL